MKGLNKQERLHKQKRLCKEKRLWLLGIFPAVFVVWLMNNQAKTLIKLTQEMFSIDPMEIDLPTVKRHEEVRKRGGGEKEAVMVLAAVPFDTRHAVSLWSEVECFVGSASHLVVSSAHWAMPIMDRILMEARKNIPKFASGEVAIEARYFDNDRYDAGLWCDALQEFQAQGKYGYFLLLNDSIFALREYDGIMQVLHHSNHSLVSLNRHEKKEDQKFWVESVFRGLDEFGLSKYLSHSCASHITGSFCRRKSAERQKLCIVEHLEINLVDKIPHPQAVGLYDGRVPEHMKTRKKPWYGWMNHDVYWRFLVKEHGFPAAKVKSFEMVANNSDPIIGNCTRYLNRTFLEDITFPRSG